MKIQLNYQNSVLVLPGHVMDALKRADGKTLKALLLLASNPTNDLYEKAGDYGLTKSNVDTAIAFWQGAGIVDVIEEPSEEQVSTVPEAPQLTEQSSKRHTKVVREEGGDYSPQEIAGILAGKPDLSQLIEECQNIYGKVFNVHESSILVGLVDYLGLDMEYILSLVTYCASMDRKSVHTIRKMAYELYDQGITDADALHEHLRRLEQVQGNCGKIRKLFGIGSRSFTSKEQQMINRWFENYHYDIEHIQIAYEATVNASGTASLPYADAVIKRWYEEGLHTVEQIQADMQNRANKKEIPEEPTKPTGKRKISGTPTGPSSFDADLFLSAALSRSQRAQDEDNQKSK